MEVIRQTLTSVSSNNTRFVSVQSGADPRTSLLRSEIPRKCGCTATVLKRIMQILVYRVLVIFSIGSTEENKKIETMTCHKNSGFRVFATYDTYWYYELSVYFGPRCKASSQVSCVGHPLHCTRSSRAHEIMLLDRFVAPAKSDVRTRVKKETTGNQHRCHTPKQREEPSNSPASYKPTRTQIP